MKAHEMMGWFDKQQTKQPNLGLCMIWSKNNED
jgi:hypothetical protein